MNFNMEVEMADALSRQEGGNHYKSMAIQPVEYIHANGIGYFEGNVIKYVSRWKAKNGFEDLKKARHYLDLLIDLEERRRAAGVFVADGGVSQVSEVSSPWGIFEHRTRL